MSTITPTTRSVDRGTPSAGKPDVRTLPAFRYVAAATRLAQEFSEWR